MSEGEGAIRETAGMWQALESIRKLVDQELNILLFSYLDKYLRGEPGKFIITNPKIYAKYERPSMNALMSGGTFLAESGVRIDFHFEIRDPGNLTDQELVDAWADGLIEGGVMTADEAMLFPPSPVAPNLDMDALECSEDEDEFVEHSSQDE